MPDDKFERINVDVRPRPEWTTGEKILLVIMCCIGLTILVLFL